VLLIIEEMKEIWRLSKTIDNWQSQTQQFIYSLSTQRHVLGQ